MKLIRSKDGPFRVTGQTFHDGLVSWTYLFIEATADAELQQLGDALTLAQKNCAGQEAVWAVVFSANSIQARSHFEQPGSRITTQFVQQPVPGAPFALMLTLIGGSAIVRSGAEVTSVATEEVELGFFSVSATHNLQLGQDGYRSAYERADALLRQINLSFGQVARMFTAQAHDTQVERTFADFNVARVRFFDGQFFGMTESGGVSYPTYPANTGTINGEAVVSLAGLVVGGIGYARCALQNPAQIPPTTYQKAGLTSAPPLFSRGLALVGKTHAQTFVSGNVAVVGSKVLHADDTAAQTEVVLDNISTLTSINNLRSHGIEVDDTNILYLLAFVRDWADIEIVRAAVEARHGVDVPTLYVQAAQALEGLCIEIEAVTLHTLSSSVS